MNVLLWFKRDLRVSDHPALALAAGMGRVLPVYIVEPEAWAQPDASARQWGFVAESLADLRGALAGMGAPLVVRVGSAVAVLEKLCRAQNITRIISHEETGNLWSFARDRQVAAWARAAGIEWTQVPQSGVQRGGPRRADWAGGHDRFMAQPLAECAALSVVPGVEPGVIPNARALRLADDPCPHRQAGGRVRGLMSLDSFLTLRGAPYQAAMSSPLTAERACSRLSPYIAQGALSLREVVQATTARQAERPGPDWGGSLRSFQKRLIWHDHFIQKLENAPDMERRALHGVADVPRGTQADRLAAWANGQTGLPFVDAVMRYLAATGWLNFRARAMVLSVACAHLWLDWRLAGQVLARRFTDYDPGIHWPQVQMQAGVTGINSLRIYNPVKQGWDQDPKGVFTRRWVPELATVPDSFLQEPWRWPGAQSVLGRRYPEPLVDVTGAARAARAALGLARAKRGFAQVSDMVIEQFGSPSRDGRFVNDRVARRRFQDAGQLCLDL